MQWEDLVRWYIKWFSVMEKSDVIMSSLSGEAHSRVNEENAFKYENEGETQEQSEASWAHGKPNRIPGVASTAETIGCAGYSHFHA